MTVTVRSRLLACLAITSMTVVPSLFRSSNPLRILDLKAYDLHMILMAPRVPPDIALVVIDQKSIERYSDPLLFWHRYYARALDASVKAGARAIGLDIVFGVPVDRWERGLDEELAAAVLRARNTIPVVCGTAAPIHTRQKEWPVPVNMACAAQARTGFVNLRAGEDDFIREIETTSVDGHPAFAMALAEARLGARPPVPQRVIRIRYAGPSGTVARVSLADFLAASEAEDIDRLRAWVQGKVVLLGPDLITDRHATPYYAFRSGVQANTSGVEIHASALDTILSGRFLLDLPMLWIFLIPLILVGAPHILFWTSRGWRLAAAAAGSLLILVAVSHILFLSGRVAPTASWGAGWAAASMGAIILRAAFEERRGSLFRKALSLFVGRGVAEEVESTGHLELRAKRVMVTVLFTDVRGFTAYCEAHEPEEVLVRLNEYFQQLTTIVSRQQGEVVKLIGDGMLAMFTGPQSGARAVTAARDIVILPGDFRTRAGLHTGWAVVGNMGSSDKLEYTVLGDTVNIASRLETLNKELDTDILLSEAVYRELGNTFALRPAGDVAIRGRSAALPVYTVE